MSHLLRRPGAVPALFSPVVEAESGPEPRAVAFRLRDASSLVILPFVVLSAEVPFVRHAADVLRLVLPH